VYCGVHNFHYILIAFNFTDITSKLPAIVLSVIINVGNVSYRNCRNVRDVSAESQFKYVFCRTVIL
jgi:hypothetical protein